MADHQEYTLVRLNVSNFKGTNARAAMCVSCGALVYDKDAHDGWHNYVERAVHTVNREG